MVSGGNKKVLDKLDRVSESNSGILDTLRTGFEDSAVLAKTNAELVQQVRELEARNLAVEAKNQQLQATMLQYFMDLQSAASGIQVTQQQLPVIQRLQPPALQHSAALPALPARQPQLLDNATASSEYPYACVTPVAMRLGVRAEIDRPDYQEIGSGRRNTVPEAFRHVNFFSNTNATNNVRNSTHNMFNRQPGP